MTADTDPNDAKSLSATFPETAAARSRHCLYLGCGLAQLVSLSLIVGCGVYCHFDPSYNSAPNGVAFGVSVSIVNVAALWSALGPLPLFTRVPLAILLVGATSLMLVVFAALDDINNETQLSIVLLIVPPIMTAQFAGVTACFLLLRRALNLRVGLPGGDISKHRGSSQFGIGQLLLWTTGIAVLVGGFRFLAIGVLPQGLKDIAMPISNIALQVMIFLIFNVILTLPIPWSVLRGGHPWIRVPLAFLLISAVIGVQYVVYSTQLLGVPGPDLLYLALQNFSAAILLTVNMIIVRQCGYRLVREGGS